MPIFQRRFPVIAANLIADEVHPNGQRIGAARDGERSRILRPRPPSAPSGQLANAYNWRHLALFTVRITGKCIGGKIQLI